MAKKLSSSRKSQSKKELLKKSSKSSRGWFWNRSSNVVERAKTEDYTSRIRVSGSRPKKAIIESPSGRYEIKIKPSDTGTDFVFKKNRYIFDGNAIKTKTPTFIEGAQMWLMYCGAMFMMFGIVVPQIFIFGVFNMFAGVAFKVSGQMFQETYSLYYEGQPKPVRYDTSPAHLLPAVIRDKSGRIVDVKFHDGATFDAAVAPHVVRDLTSGGPELDWDKMKWVVIAIVVAVAVYGIAKYAGVIG